MLETQGYRTYERSECAVFLKTAEQFGGLSNMAGGYVLTINGVRILTSEALYQACRFPHLSEVQKLIVEESYRDQFWGAKPTDAETLVGMNILGRLLVELRERLRTPEAYRLWVAEPPPLSRFLFLDKPIGIIGCPEPKLNIAMPSQNMTFAQQVIAEESSESTIIADSETEPLKAISPLTDVEKSLSNAPNQVNATPVQGVLLLLPDS